MCLIIKAVRVKLEIVVSPAPSAFQLSLQCVSEQLRFYLKLKSANSNFFIKEPNIMFIAYIRAVFKQESFLPFLIGDLILQTYLYNVSFVRLRKTTRKLRVLVLSFFSPCLCQT